MNAGAAWTSLPLQPGVSLVVDRDMPCLPTDLEGAVAAVWADERRRRPALFNGRVFCADRIAPDLIGGHWTEYRRVLAQMRHPALFGTQPIRALAVNGLLECADGLVLGRRQADAVYLPGCWQAAPAGAVEARKGDELDLAGQLLAELEEELGLLASDIVALRPVVAIEHAGTRIVDVGFQMRTTLSFRDIGTRHSSRGNGEYQDLQVVALPELDRFLRDAGPTLLPSARILMEYRSAA